MTDKSEKAKVWNMPAVPEQILDWEQLTGKTIKSVVEFEYGESTILIFESGEIACIKAEVNWREAELSLDYIRFESLPVHTLERLSEDNIISDNFIKWKKEKYRINKKSNEDNLRRMRYEEYKRLSKEFEDDDPPPKPEKDTTPEW